MSWQWSMMVNTDQEKHLKYFFGIHTRGYEEFWRMANCFLGTSLRREIRHGLPNWSCSSLEFRPSKFFAATVAHDDSLSFLSGNWPWPLFTLVNRHQPWLSKELTSVNHHHYLFFDAVEPSAAPPEVFLSPKQARSAGPWCSLARWVPIIVSWSYD